MAANPALADDEPQPAERFTNRDLMEMPPVERERWIHGAVVGLANGVGLSDVEAGACVARWFFEDQDRVSEEIEANAERFPDHPPAVVMIALARRECPEIGN